MTYDDGTVYYGDQPVASAEQYYDQAGQIADSGQATAERRVAAPGRVRRDHRAHADADRQGRPTCLEQGGRHSRQLAGLRSTDKVMPVVGAVDKKTQRVAMKLEGNDSVVVETGLYNLTNDEVPVLVHFGPDRTEDRTLIRLKQPEEQTQPAAIAGRCIRGLARCDNRPRLYDRH